MFFRRAVEKRPTFEERVSALGGFGFDVVTAGGGVEVRRGRFVALVRPDAAGQPEIVRAGVLLAGEPAVLVDGGFQKFLETPSGKRRPALSADLAGLHDFQEDLTEGLGIESLYNQSLGTVCARHAYDRLSGRR